MQELRLSEGAVAPFSHLKLTPVLYCMYLLIYSMYLLFSE